MHCEQLLSMPKVVVQFPGAQYGQFCAKESTIRHRMINIKINYLTPFKSTRLIDTNLTPKTYKKSIFIYQKRTQSFFLSFTTLNQIFEVSLLIYLRFYIFFAL